MAKTKKERDYQREYRKQHPEVDRKYRLLHKAEIAEYNRQHPELRVRLSIQQHAELHKFFGDDITKWLRGVIAREVYKAGLPLVTNHGIRSTS